MYYHSGIEPIPLIGIGCSYEATDSVLEAISGRICRNGYASIDMDWFN